ncbi:MAG: YdiU family protein [Planctomycetes bacterium]|nr:YdiU family protein [Planctomycetota bacterium]
MASIGWRFENTYSRLPQVFFASAQPAVVSSPSVVILNDPLAADLGLNLQPVSSSTAAGLFAGQILPAGSQPIAQAYAGHQFGGFTMLGDGRAILLGEHRTPTGQLVDIQFKGTGPTRFSRRGDGRAALGPMLREYIISEAMFGLGIPTTRSLAVVTTGEPVFRETRLPGAILTRVAASHIRVGTFEFLAAREDTANLQVLADYAINRHYPELTGTPNRFLQFLRMVCNRQASLIARWQLVGFIHGVMNTDNMAISGETIDYGPCAFMNAYSPDTVFSSIDHAGRYAYGNQPGIAQWNLVRFAETLLPLLDSKIEQAIEFAKEILGEYPAMFQQYWLQGMRAKLGLTTEVDDDLELVQTLLTWMESVRADFTNTFRDLSEDEPRAGTPYDAPAFRTWYDRWKSRVQRENRPLSEVRTAMQRANPAVIPRNHLVEEALAAAHHGDLAPLHNLLRVLATPYTLDASSKTYREPPDDDRQYRTFCGT